MGLGVSFGVFLERVKPKTSTPSHFLSLSLRSFGRCRHNHRRPRRSSLAARRSRALFPPSCFLPPLFVFGVALLLACCRDGDAGGSVVVLFLFAVVLRRTACSPLTDPRRSTNYGESSELCSLVSPCSVEQR
ncbi:hypothetical protein BVRB_6g136450 isoform B [Beta vulgaris subsp. vulgaris]|nr:hypothetical protein BVRB_6g136450 isoform B [Beta vulgaris subsp. vulgaris]